MEKLEGDGIMSLTLVESGCNGAASFNEVWNATILKSKPPDLPHHPGIQTKTMVSPANEFRTQAREL